MIKRFIRNFVIVSVSVVLIGTLIGQYLRHFTEGAEYPVREYVEVEGEELPEGLALVADIRGFTLDPAYAAAILDYYEAHPQSSNARQARNSRKLRRLAV